MNHHKYKVILLIIAINDMFSYDNLKKILSLFRWGRYNLSRESWL